MTSSFDSSSMPPALLEWMAEEAKKQLCRLDFSQFIQMIRPRYLMSWVHHELAQFLQDFEAAVARGESPRYAIFMPPRHGKSEQASRLFPAWCLGRNPALQIIFTSYGADLAESMCESVQAVMDSPSYVDLFPGSKLLPPGSKGRGIDKRNRTEFNVIGHPQSYIATGIIGSITGRGANMLIIDDPVRGAADANSATLREKIWEEFRGTLRTRLHPGGGILLIQTRWHEQDLAGMILQHEIDCGRSNRWRVINYPAIAEVDELHRKKGGALHPARYSLEELLETKQLLGSYIFDALYQQRPSPRGGGLIQGEWFRRYHELPPIKLKAIFCDTALTTKTSSDYSVLQCWGLDDDGIMHLIDQVRGKWTTHQLEQRVSDFYYAHRETRGNEGFLGIWIEEETASLSLVDGIKKRHGIPIRPLSSEGKDKFTRLMTVQGWIECGFVSIPEVSPWCKDFIHECESFREDMKHVHDDQVDAMVYAINLFSQYSSWGKKRKSMLEKLQINAGSSYKPSYGRPIAGQF